MYRVSQFNDAVLLFTAVLQGEFLIDKIFIKKKSNLICYSNLEHPIGRLYLFGFDNSKLVTS